jgi:hypothetical protein
MDNDDIVIKGNIASFNLPPTEGEILGTYSGHFEVKCYLTPTEQLDAGREYRNLLGANAALASETESNLSFALVQLKYRVLKSPPFWSSTLQHSAYAGNIPDLNIIILVLDSAIRAENLFKEKIVKEREEILTKSIKKIEDTLKKEKEV